MFRASHSLLLGVGALAAITLTSCGNSVSTTTTTGSTGTAMGTSTGTGSSTSTGSGTGGTGGSNSNIGRPPARGAMKPATGQGHTYAISKFYFGDTDPDGTPDAQSGWKHYGYNLDAKTSVATSTDLCKPRDSAAPKNVYPDGDNGADNSWGHNVLPIELGIASDFSAKQNDLITSGKSTVLLDLEGLGADTDTNPLATKLYASGDLMGSPKFDGTDAWPVRSDSLTVATDITTAKVSLPTGYLVGSTWVSGDMGCITLPLPSFLPGSNSNVTLCNAVITMDLSADRRSATHGVISGVLNTDEYTTQVKEDAGQFDPSLCSGTTIDSVVAQITQASDILADGTQDPTKPCTGISIALGFDAQEVTLGPIQDPPPPKPPACCIASGMPCDPSSGMACCMGSCAGVCQ